MQGARAVHSHAWKCVKREVRERIEKKQGLQGTANIPTAICGEGITQIAFINFSVPSAFLIVLFLGERI